MRCLTNSVSWQGLLGRGGGGGGIGGFGSLKGLSLNPRMYPSDTRRGAPCELDMISVCERVERNVSRDYQIRVADLLTHEGKRGPILI